jgi:hypothetical protein
MNLTINPSDYAQLLAKYQPKVIETEAESDRAIELAQEIAHYSIKKMRTKAEQLFYCSLGIVCIVDSSCSIDWFSNRRSYF